MKTTDDNAVVLLKTYARAADAYIAKGMLEAHGIPAIVNDSNISTIYGGLLPDLDARLCVRATDYDKAAALLVQSGDTVDDSDDDEPLQPTRRQQRILKIAQIVIGIILAALIVVFLLSGSVV